MSVGFLGIQMGFALQNANASRILQSFGADVHQLSWFWIVAPLTGMIVQPIIGHYSDHTWTGLGRRRPYFLTGAILACIGLCFLPNADLLVAIMPALWVGAGMLMIMDASFNISMEPFRALVADKLPEEQQTMGFSVQTILIGIGAIIGSSLPYVLGEWLGVSKESIDGSIPANVVYSFFIGAVCLLGAIIWTVTTTSEYSPEEMQQFAGDEHGDEVEEEESTSLLNIFSDFANMPTTMKQLGVVQFFSWFGLFMMWVYATSAVAQHVYGTSVEDHTSQAFQDAGNWVGIIFTVYSAVSAIWAFLLPSIASKIGRKSTHALCLFLGAIGFLSIYFCTTKEALIFPMIGIGIAWASILAMPYAILSGSLPAKKIGIYMGLFNFFITLPQILCAITAGPILKAFFDSHAIYAFVIGGVSLLIAAASVYLVDDARDVATKKM